MKHLNIPTRDEVASKAQQIFDDFKNKMDMVPNLYAVIGHSANALETYLSFSNGQAEGSFNAREREAINLAVSQTNQCNYCLAAHTAIGKMNDFDDDDIMQLRDGSITDEKLRILSRLATSITENRGSADPDLVDAFFAAGYDKTALVDLVAQVADKTFSNYIGRLTNVTVDFPEAAPITE